MSGAGRISTGYQQPRDYESMTFKSLDAYLEFLRKCRRDFDDAWKQRWPTGSLDDWERMRTLGSGSFGRVVLVRSKLNGHFCVMKIMEKAKLVKQKQVAHLLDERRALNYVKFPFLVYLISSFRSFNYVFFVMPFVSGGEMFPYLRKVGKFSEDQARFYAAQVVLAFEYMHNVDLIYRDLKPENILFDESGYLKLADFGFCKVVKSRTWTLCGTPEYLAPELILSKGYGKAADWWTLGVLIYEMTAGSAPFYGGETMVLYDKITSGKYPVIPHSSAELQDLIRHLLQTDLTRRYGNLKDGVNDIRKHAWFRPIDWLAVLNKQIKAPYIPPRRSPGDAGNFGHCEEVLLKEASCDQFTNEFRDF